jgi:hypothetical protein
VRVVRCHNVGGPFGVDDTVMRKGIHLSRERRKTKRERERTVVKNKGTCAIASATACNAWGADNYAHTSMHTIGPNKRRVGCTIVLRMCEGTHTLEGTGRTTLGRWADGDATVITALGEENAAESGRRAEAGGDNTGERE